MTTSIKKIALLAGLLFTTVTMMQVTAETVGDVAPAGLTQCVDLKNNLIITSRDRNTNGEVTLLQEFLQEAGFLIPDPTGYFGAQTKAAVMKFQKSVGLIDSGYVATYTRAAIKKASCSGTSAGGSSSSGVACTMEARLCSDGSMMPRASDCTWLPNQCPSAPAQTTNTCNYYENGSVAAVFGGTAQCTKSIEGKAAPGLPNVICKCPSSSSNTTSSSGSKASQVKVTVSNSTAGPWLPSGTSVCNSGKIYLQATSVSKSANPKGCMAPAGMSCTPRAFYSDEWVDDNTIRATFSGGDYQNGTYDSYVSFPGEALTKVGSVTLKTCSTPASTGKVCAYEGAVFGGSPPCTEAIEGQNNGSRCTCKTTGSSGNEATTNPVKKVSLAKLTVSNSLSGPWLASGSGVCNAGKIYIKAEGLIKSSTPKGCMAPAGATCAPREFYPDEWGNSTDTIIATASGGDYQNGTYYTYLSYPGEPTTLTGSLTLKTCSTPASTGKVCAYEGAVFGGSPPCTEAIEGQNNGSRCTCTTSTGGATGSSPSAANVTLYVSNSPSGPWTKDGTVVNSGTIYSQARGLVKSKNPKGCASPAGDTGCLSPSAHRDFTEAEWGGTTDTVTTSVQGGIFPNQSYDSYVMYPGQTPVKIGTFTIRPAQSRYEWGCTTFGGPVTPPAKTCSASNVNEAVNVSGGTCYCGERISAVPTNILIAENTSSTESFSSLALSLLTNISKSLLNGFALGGSTAVSGGQGQVLGVSVAKKECVALTKNLHRGDESYQTTMLQNFLNEKGFLSEKASGFYGDLTIAAVKKYQSSIGIPETGMVYDLTRQAIQDETCTY